VTRIRSDSGVKSLPVRCEVTRRRSDSDDVLHSHVSEPFTFRVSRETDTRTGASESPSPVQHGGLPHAHPSPYAIPKLRTVFALPPTSQAPPLPSLSFSSPLPPHIPFLALPSPLPYVPIARLLVFLSLLRLSRSSGLSSALSLVLLPSFRFEPATARCCGGARCSRTVTARAKSQL
jgi:hypothetical protein